MTAPNEWEAFRTLFSKHAVRKGYADTVPQRYGGTAEELYCFPAISKTIADMGEADFIEIMEAIFDNNAAARKRVVAVSRDYFARARAGEKLTRKEAKTEWKAVTNRETDRENAEAAVVWGLAAMLQEAP